MTQTTDQRRYSAILAMDVVGYARLVEDDELGTIRAVQRLRDDIIRPALSACDGRLVKTMGDGFLAEFTSPDQAFRAAVEIQEKALKLAKNVPAKRCIVLRIGAHLGDVIVEEEDILGDGVNLAARLEVLARPGGIACSATFVDALDQDLAAILKDDGAHSVKNISRPIQVWRWASEHISIELPADTTSRPPTIAVLPFINRSTDPDQAFFAEGLAEDIISALQHMGRLPVVSAASSLSVDPGLRVEDVSRLLGARYVVKGSVRRASTRVRVTVELVEGQTAQSLWSAKYDRSFEDVFEIQDDITLRVVSALDAELVEGEINRLRRQRPENLGAWERYLRGMSYLRNLRGQDLVKAQKEFQAAIDIAPEYGEAWAALAWSYLKEYGFNSFQKSKTLLDQGYHAAEKALAYADRSPFAHYSMSTAHVWRGEKELSLNELEHAIQLNPYFIRAKLALHNRRELADPNIGLEAAEELRKALALSPREPDRSFYFWAIARINVVGGEYLEALDWADRALSVHPTNPSFIFRRAICLAALDRVQEARDLLSECDTLSPGFVEKQSDWRPYDESDARNDKLFAGFARHGLAGWD